MGGRFCYEDTNTKSARQHFQEHQGEAIAVAETYTLYTYESLNPKIDSCCVQQWK